MSVWQWLDGGISMPAAEGWRRRFALWVGRRLAMRHRYVTAHPTCRISPEARICPRNGCIEFGPHCTVAPGAIVQGNVTLGEQCSIQAYSVIVGYGTRDQPSGRICIGNNVRIAPHVMMIAADHIFDDPHRPIHGQGLLHAPIIIEDDVWVAGHVSVTAGVTIGTGSVIGAGSVVTRDIPPYSLAVGVPARVMRSRQASAQTDAPQTQ